MGLVDWAGTQPAWVGDSLRRIATSENFGLSAEHEAAILARVRVEAAGTEGEDLPCVPINASHLAADLSAVADRVVIAELGPVEHVDRLAAGQILRFAPSGITLVFGENGSGKSGYTRITKHFCRSLSAGALKGNIFAPPAAGPIAVHVKYKVGDAELAGFDWTPGQDSPAPLKQISVFDSHNAQLYVDQQNRIAYLPEQIAILEHHGALCEKLASELTAEGRTLETRVKVPLPAGYSQGSLVDTLLARLHAKAQLPTRQDFETIAGLTAAEEADLLSLEKDLAQDPAIAAGARRSAKKALDRLSVIFAELDADLSAEAAAALAASRTEFEAADLMASLAAGASFAGEPLPSVGSEAWRHMYDAALQYILSYSPLTVALPAKAGDACLLCQEPLNDDAASRIARFNAYVSGEAARRLDAARAALAAAVERIEGSTIPASEIVIDTLAGYAGTKAGRDALVDKVVLSLSAYGERRRTLLASLSDAEVVVAPPPAPLLQELAGEAAELETEAAELELAAVHTAAMDASRARHADLKDRKKLAHDLPTILQRLDDLVILSRIGACKTQLSTRPVSTQVSALRRALVTEKLEERIRQEIASFDLGHIPFAFSDSSQQGASRFGVELQSATKHKNSQVLSEGEQRALALACFLAEIGDETASYGIIVDDPVSSLDQRRIRRVAARLVAEARKGRQVIIFTHSLVFFNEVMAEAAKAGPEAPVLTNIVRKTEADGFGVIDQDSDLWIARGINSRIADLRARAKAMADESALDDDGYRRRARDFYADLRESWERAVEEVVLNKTIERLVPDVKTQSLKGVNVTDEDYRTIFFAMKKASERSGHDMAAGRDIPIPTPADMLADLEELDAFRVDCNKRRKAVAEARSALESAVKAAVL